MRQTNTHLVQVVKQRLLEIKGGFSFVRGTFCNNSAHKTMGFHLGIDWLEARINCRNFRIVVPGEFHSVEKPSAAEYFANTNPPIPVASVLTEEEAVRYLRLDEGARCPESARRSFRRLVETKRIRGARIGRRARYLREELLRFARHATELSGDAPNPTK